MPKSPINIVWFKRDLRFTDHEPLFRALEEDIPVLLVYFFEPSLINFPDSDLRHWRFVHEKNLLPIDRTRSFLFRMEYFCSGWKNISIGRA